MSTMAWRYVEVAYRLDGADRWAGTVTEARLPSTAIRDACEWVKDTHPAATQIQMFVARTISERKAKQITEALENGTWGGWFTQEAA